MNPDVAVVLIEERGLVLAVTEPDAERLRLPGGRVGVDEDARDVAVRELNRQTGLIVGRRSLNEIFRGETPSESGALVTVAFQAREYAGSVEAAVLRPVWTSWEELLSGPTGEFLQRMRYAMRRETWPARTDADIIASMTEIAHALEGFGARVAHENELRDAVRALFDKAGVSYEAEVGLDKQSRIDFVVGQVGVELKVAESLAAVIRQLDRYAAHPRIGGLVLVTTRRRLQAVPASLHGKPVTVVCMGTL